MTYGRIVVDYRPQKYDPHQVRLMVGGNLINYTGNMLIPTVDINKEKLILSSVVSTQDQDKYVATLKIYLGTPRY